jgi:hypothetical protein
VQESRDLCSLTKKSTRGGGEDCTILTSSSTSMSFQELIERAAARRITINFYVFRAALPASLSLNYVLCVWEAAARSSLMLYCVVMLHRATRYVVFFGHFHGNIFAYNPSAKRQTARNNGVASEREG